MSILNEKIYGFTRGIVIKNDDPAKRGRVKIFLPSYPALILNGSYSINKVGKKIQPSDVAAQYLKTEAAAAGARDVLGHGDSDAASGSGGGAGFLRLYVVAAPVT